MKIVSKKKINDLEIKIINQQEHIDYLKKQLSAKQKDNLRLADELHSKKKYSEDYVKLYIEARNKNFLLEEELVNQKSKCETLKIANEKIKKDLNIYEETAKKAFGKLETKASNKRLKKKREKELYYAVLQAQKK